MNIAEDKAAIRRDAKTLKAQFSKRCEISEYLNMANEAAQVYGFQLVNTPSTGFFKEVYLASRFAPRRGASHVWLEKTDPPDFWIEVEGEQISFEVAEIIRPGRKRDLELQQIYESGEAMADPAENRLTIAENCDLVTGAIAVKSGAKHQHVHGLLLYLNTGWIDHPGGHLGAFEDVVAACKTKLFQTHYLEIWLTQSNACERIS